MYAERKIKNPKKQLIGKDFRFFLQNELTDRCSKNLNYSLRSFAKSLLISPSALSAMINGKRPLTTKMKEKLGLRLGLKIEDLKKFKSHAHGNSKSKDESIPSDLFQQITVDTFAIISEPFHYALLELIKTYNFKWDPKWIAHRLQRTVSEINIALERLERVGLLERNGKGEIIDATSGFTTDIRNGLTSDGQRRFQERSLEKAISAVQSLPVNLRDNTSMTMAINIKDLLLAKQLIKEFRRKFCTKLEEQAQLDQVYQLTISFVPLTNISGDQK